MRGFDEAVLITYGTLDGVELAAAEFTDAKTPARREVEARAAALLDLIGQFEDHRERVYGGRSKWDAERKQRTGER